MLLCDLIQVMDFHYISNGVDLHLSYYYSIAYLYTYPVAMYIGTLITGMYMHGHCYKRQEIQKHHSLLELAKVQW